LFKPSLIHSSYTVDFKPWPLFEIAYSSVSFLELGAAFCAAFPPRGGKCVECELAACEKLTDEYAISKAQGLKSPVYERVDQEG